MSGDEHGRHPDLYREIVRLRQEGRKAALATIIRRLGSAPRKDNAKMLIREDGSSLGSVGGGCVEAEIWQVAQKVMRTGQPDLLKYHLTDEDVEEQGLVCGGSVELFVEPILSDPKAIILGAGHLGQATAEVAGRVGFRVSVIDDRENFANRDRFPTAEEVLVRPFEEGLSDLDIPEDSFLLIVTRGHRHDQIALEAAIQPPARYVGLVGSRRKIRILVEKLLQKGYSPEAFRNLYAPIGIEIGSETPQEIAVSVVAEWIAIIKGVHERSDKQLYIMKLLEKAAKAKVGVGPP
ncbi:MAG: XdhC family protein [Acidobacteriota bacterium]